MDYEYIFDLIDQSNDGYVSAENELIEMGIYGDDGDIITDDQVILKYYEDKYGLA